MTVWIRSIVRGSQNLFLQKECHDWPHFRGPNGSGIATDSKPPVTFGPDQNVKWKVPAPSGASSPVIVGDRLFLTAFDDGKLFTVAYSTINGRELWRAEAPAKTIEA